MSFDSWTVLMVRKGPGVIPDDVSASLKMAACDLYLNKFDRMRVETDACSGFIETSWDTQTVGTRTGVLFRSHVDDEDDEYQINFLLATADLERGAAWLRKLAEEGSGVWRTGEGKVSCEALYDFRDLREKSPNRRMLH